MITSMALALALLNAAIFVYRGKFIAATAASGGSLSVGPVHLLAAGELARIFPSSAIYAEMVREAASLAALVCAALLAGRDRVERLAAFLWSFGAFTLAYYSIRFIFFGAPRSIASTDILILPLRSLSVPVYLPLAVGIIAIALAAIIYALKGSRHVGRLTL